MRILHRNIVVRAVILCTVIMMCVAGINISVNAAEVEKANRTYDIAVVFDNSGSMYFNEAWCRAKYAIEIFASMPNYENGDRLRIYPMWPVVTDGSTPSSGGSIDPVEITGQSDIDKIYNMYTVKPSETPFAPVTEAYEDLKNSSADEKWLIVLTDGEFNQDARDEFEDVDLQARLGELASNDINVQYLGVGKAATLKSDEGKFFYALNSSDTSLKEDLVNICNVIFRRSPLPDNALNGEKLTLDISMNNIIVFVQGENAKIGSLKNDDGKEIEVTLDSGLLRYSEIGAGGEKYKNAPVDTSLAGQVKTFAACDKGEYTLDYSGADTIQIFYEPNVDLRVVVTDDEGEELDMSKSKISAGEYTMNYSFVDNVTGEDVTNSSLMGDVNLTGTVIDSKGNETVVENGGKVFLQPDEATFIKVEGTYLDGYRITTEDDKDAYTFKIHTKLDTEIDVKQPDSWYKLSNHEKWKPICVSVSYDGKKLSDELMKELDVQIEFTEPLSYYYEIIPGESAFNIYIGVDENGNYTEPATGKYKITVNTASGEASDKASEKFRIEKYSSFWFWVIRLGILLLIIALIVWWMTRKVLPKSISIKPDSTDFRIWPAFNTVEGVFASAIYSRKSKRLEIKTPMTVGKEGCNYSVVLGLEPCDRRYVRSKDRRVMVTDISANGNVVGSVEFPGKEYIYDTGLKRYVDSNFLDDHDEDTPVPPINARIKNATVYIKGFRQTANGKKLEASTLECTLRHK